MPHSHVLLKDILIKDGSHVQWLSVVKEIPDDCRDAGANKSNAAALPGCGKAVGLWLRILTYPTQSGCEMGHSMCVCKHAMMSTQ